MRLAKRLGAAAAIGVGLAGGASAAPLTPGTLGLSAGDAPIEQVRDFCGPGGHRNIYGQCRSNYPRGPRYGYGGGYRDRPFGAPPPRPFYKPYGTPNY